MSATMTPAEALAYHQKANYRRTKDGSPWPYITAILSDPEHPEHQRVLESITAHRDRRRLDYRMAQRELAVMSERYPADDIVIVTLQRRADAARAVLA